MNASQLNADSPSIEVERGRNTLCDRFEAAWKEVSRGGARPNLATFIQDGSADPELVRELIALDLYYRRRCGEQPSPGDYATFGQSLDEACFSGDGAERASLMTKSTPGPTENERYGAAQLQSGYGPLPRIFGAYELVEEIARGGMGVVFKARQRRPQRLIALKMILSGQLASAAEVDRFRTEAEAVARLEHAHIVPIYEVGEVDGQHYFTMRLIEGGSLSRLTRRLKASPRAAARLLLQVAEAVQYAHSKAILHRDLKPANILVEGNSDGPVEELVSFVTDFGLAKRLEDDSPQTRSNALVGTPAYMAPEQAAGQIHNISTATDVYGLGAILYELITGQPPFARTNVSNLLHSVQHDDPVPVCSLNPSVPADLETICLKCLQKEPFKRYSSAADFAADLRRFLAGEPINARPVGRIERLARWCGRNRLVAGLGAASVLLLIGVAVFSTIMAFYLAEARSEADNRAEQKRLARADEARERERGQRQLVEVMANNGVRRLDEGNLFDAAVWIAEALRLAPDPSEAEMHRLRFATVWRQCPRLLHLLRHDGIVTNGALSPDNHYVATAGEDRAARIWNLTTGEPVGLPLLHESGVTFVAFSPDGRQIVTASRDYTARLWNTATGHPLCKPLRHQGQVFFAAFSPDGRLVVTTSEDQTARIWEVPTVRLLCVLRPNHGGIIHAAFSRDSRRVVTAAATGWCQVWDAATAQPAGQALMNGGHARQCAFSPDGRLVVTISDDRIARVWQATTGRSVAGLSHGDKVRYADFSPEGDRLVTASDDRTVRVWDTATWEPVTPPLLHRTGVVRATFSSDGRSVTTWAGMIDTVQEWDAATGRPLGLPVQFGTGLSCLMHSSDGRYVLTAGDGQAARIWSADPASVSHQPLRHGDVVRRASFSPDSRCILTASTDSQVLLWNADTLRSLGPPLVHPRPVAWAEFNPDGRCLVTACDTEAVRVWHTETGHLLYPPLKHGEGVSYAAFSPNGCLLVTADADDSARVWNVATGHLNCPPLAHQLKVGHAAFSPDSRRIITASHDTTARIWDSATGKPVCGRLEHRGTVNWAVFDPEGKRVMTACADGTVQVWDAATGRPIGHPLRHARNAWRASFSPDGRRIVTASTDGTVRVWDCSTGNALGSPLRHRSYVTGAAFSPDGLLLVTYGVDNSAQVWNAATGQRVTAPCNTAAPCARRNSVRTGAAS
jgi:WD40 repeat protein/serine/threonine protein kinase